MIVDTARLAVIAAACFYIVGASKADVFPRRKARFRYDFAFSQPVVSRSRRQAVAFDEFGLPRYSLAQGSTVFQVARRAVGIPGSILGSSTNVFGNESPLPLANAALQPFTQESPRYGPNHPPTGSYTIPPRYSADLSSNEVNLKDEAVSPQTDLADLTASSAAYSLDTLSITDDVTVSPTSLPESSTFVTGGSTTVQKESATASIASRLPDSSIAATSASTTVQKESSSLPTSPLQPDSSTVVNSDANTIQRDPFSFASLLPSSSTYASRDSTTIQRDSFTAGWTRAPYFFISTKPTIPFPLTIDPGTSGPPIATEAPSTTSYATLTTAAPVAR